jgi:hypothetical protein
MYINETRQKHSTTIQNTVNTSTEITKTPTNYKTHTYTHSDFTQKIKTTIVQVKTTTVQVKTNTVQDIPKLVSHNTITYIRIVQIYDFSDIALSFGG